MLPEIPGVLSEAAAGALEWARLREYVAGKAQSALGRGWVMALEASGGCGVDRRPAAADGGGEGVSAGWGEF